MLPKLIALVLPLGLDTFAVAAALGMVGVAPAHRLRLPALFTAFEAGMPLIGLTLGAPLGRTIGSAADYLAVGVLLAFGVSTLLRADDEESRRLQRLAELRGASALLLGVSISLDELAIGFTLGLLRIPPVAVIAAIAVQAFLVTQLGLRLGNRLSAHLRELAERLAGVALAAIALILLVERIVG